MVTRNGERANWGVWCGRFSAALALHTCRVLGHSGNLDGKNAISLIAIPCIVQAAYEKPSQGDYPWPGINALRDLATATCRYEGHY